MVLVRVSVGQTALMPIWARAAGYGAAVFSLVSATAQMVRLYRARSADGIAIGSWAIGTFSTVTWFAYAIAVASPQQMIANGYWLLYMVPLTWVILAPRGPRASVLGVLGVAVLFIVMLALGLLAPSAPGFVGIPASLMVSLPQIRYSLKHGRGEAVSLIGWAMLASSSTLWFVYGIGSGEAPVMLNSGVGSLLSWTVVAVLIIRPTSVDHELIAHEA